MNEKCPGCNHADPMTGYSLCEPCARKAGWAVFNGAVLSPAEKEKLHRLAEELARQPVMVFPVEKADRCHRLRRYLIPEHVVLSVLDMNTQDSVCRLMMDCLPHDAEVVSVHHVWDAKAFGFTVRHDSFDMVPTGEMIPLHKNPFRFEWVPVQNLPERIPLLDAQGRRIGWATNFRTKEGHLVADMEQDYEWLECPDIKAAMKQAADIIIKETSTDAPSSQPERRDNPFMPKSP